MIQSRNLVHRLGNGWVFDGAQVAKRPGSSDGLPIGNRRNSRLETCITSQGLLLAVCIQLFALLLGVGCSRPESRVDVGLREQILHVGNASEPEDLDPQIVTGVPEHRLLMSIFEGLVVEDPYDLHPVPGVAERWDISPDGRTYTFHLRKNARWSNGDPVTARDFLNSYKRFLTPALAARYAYMMFVVKNAEAFNQGKITDFSQVGFKAPDDHTFVITLENATSYFLSLMLHTSWYPVHVLTVEKHGDPFRRPAERAQERHDEVRDQLVFARVFSECLSILQQWHEIGGMGDDVLQGAGHLTERRPLGRQLGERGRLPVRRRGLEKPLREVHDLLVPGP